MLCYLNDWLFFVTAYEVVWKGHCGDDILPSCEWSMPSSWWGHRCKGSRSRHSFCYGHGFSTIQVNTNFFFLTEFSKCRITFVYLEYIYIEVVSFSGRIHLDQSTSIQDWRNGASCTVDSSNPVLIWPTEPPRDCLWLVFKTIRDQYKLSIMPCLEIYNLSCCS